MFQESFWEIERVVSRVFQVRLKCVLISLEGISRVFEITANIRATNVVI